MGMMMNVMSAIDLLSVPDHWAQTFCPTPEKIDRHPGGQPGRQGPAASPSWPRPTEVPA